jgi:hypothetical protein
MLPDFYFQVMGNREGTEGTTLGYGRIGTIKLKKDL